MTKEKHNYFVFWYAYKKDYQFITNKICFINS